MDTAKRLFSRFFLYLVAVCFFLTAVSWATFNVISAPNIKSVLKEEDTYNKMVPAVLSTANYGEGASTGLDLPLEEPWVVASVQRAFPASDLEEKGDAAIDGTFNWLEGETEKPEFRLDFTANKQKLTEEIGVNAQNRLNELPVCDLNNLPQSVDAFKANCLPFGLDPQMAADEAALRVNNNDFLSDPVVTSDNLPSEDGKPQDEDPFKQLDGLRSLYGNKDLLLWLLPVATVVLALAGVYLAQDRSRALKRLGRSMITAGVGLLVFAILISLAFEQALKAVSKDAVTRDLVLPVLTNLSHQARNTYLVFAAIAFVLAISLYVTRKKLIKP